MKSLDAFHNATFALLLTAALSPVPASAQRGVEYGYKDRIFEQNYVLPDPLDDRTRFAAEMLLLTRPSVQSNGRMGVPARRVVEAMGGVCRLALVPVVSHEEKTPAQAELEKMAAVRVQTSQAQSPSVNTDTSDDGTCQLQMALFDIAYADPLSTDAQLAQLAAHMRRRYTKVWASTADVFDPQVAEGATRLARIASRAARFQKSGVAIPTEVAAVVLDAEADLVGTVRRLAQAEPYGTIESGLTQAENAATRTAREEQLRRAQEQAEAERQEAERRQRAPQPGNAAENSTQPDEVCRQGAICRMIEVTLFCRTPQQMAAILSQRPGPARKQVLEVFVSSGDCRQVGLGETLHWTASITAVQPKGEPMAELVPGTLADGTPGFLLKDGIIARSAGATR